MCMCAVCVHIRAYSLTIPRQMCKFVCVLARMEQTCVDVRPHTPT